MILVKLNNDQDLSDGVTFVKGARGRKTRDAHISANLETGSYLFFTEMEWVDQECYTEREYSVTRYGPGESEMV